jgi:hypothetical protein
VRIAILSDIHDNLWNLAAALESVASAEVLICCGDLCSPFVMDELARFPGQVQIVFGNNDADLFRITRKSSPRVQVHGELFETDLDGRRVAAHHFDSIARRLAESGQYDLLCYGHNHRFHVARIGRTLAVNPGPIMGAAFYTGGWQDVPATFAVFDTATGDVQAFQIARREVKPYDFTVAERWP